MLVRCTEVAKTLALWGFPSSNDIRQNIIVIVGSRLNFVAETRCYAPFVTSVRLSANKFQFLSCLNEFFLTLAKKLLCRVLSSSAFASECFGQPSHCLVSGAGFTHSLLLRKNTYEVGLLHWIVSIWTINATLFRWYKFNWNTFCDSRDFTISGQKVWRYW